MEEADLDLVVAGTKDAVLMIEGSAKFVPENVLVEALELGLSAISTIASAIAEWASDLAKPPFTPALRTPPEGLEAALGELGAREAIEGGLSGGTKAEREGAWLALQNQLLEQLSAGSGGKYEFEPADVKRRLKSLSAEAMRAVVGRSAVRTDGRGLAEVRPIEIRMKPLPPQVHGSALFTRGETQSLATVTLGDGGMAQRYENLEGEQSKRFYLQYSFPPFSVGEVGRIGPPGRREVGHGNLAERALRAALPAEAEFPYTMRVESLITESCGSSSMASVCAGCLAMFAAGVPLTSPVAGIAMGLLLDESGGDGEPIVLTDILGSEDALGTMDFKVAGNAEGVSAFQLDIKCEGLSLELLRTALEQAPRSSRDVMRRRDVRR